MAHIGIDIDGVVYDFQTTFHQYASEKLQRDLPLPNTWLFYSEQWGLSDDEYLDMLVTGIKEYNVFWKGPAIPYAEYGVSELYKRGHEISFITARGIAHSKKECMMATEYWLGSMGFPYHQVTYDVDKTGYGIDLLIDDAPMNYIARKQKGQQTLVFHQLWNEELVDAPRAHDWVEVIEYVEKNF